MKLLDVLASGIRGAENGSVDIFVRGTSTRAQVFTDYDGTGAQTPPASLVLDSFGGAVWYVNQAVLCKVYDSLGAPVRQFTAFETATDVEVRSPSFTGVDYTTGASAAGNPQLLSTILDLWKTSAGAVDFNVLVGSATKTITAALTAVSGLFFNVKDPAYGAVGDGVADDRVAIQAAITAANLVGGIVYFPPGTYLVGSPGLTVNGAAGFWGSNGVVVNSTFAGGIQITVTNGATGKFYIRDMRWATTSTTTGWITVANSTDAVIENCVVTCARIANQAALFGNGDVYLLNTKFNLSGTGGTMSNVFGSNGPIVAINSEFVSVLGADTTTAPLILGGGGAIIGCRFSASGGTPGVYVSWQTAGKGLVAGCDFANAPSANTAIGTGGTVFGLSEVGNSFDTTVTPYKSLGLFAADATTNWGRALSLEANSFFATTDAASVTLTTQYGVHRIRRTTATGQTILMPTVQAAGIEMELTIINDSVGTPTETLTTIKGLAAVGPITAAHRVTIKVRSVVVGTFGFWVLLSSTDWS